MTDIQAAVTANGTSVDGDDKKPLAKSSQAEKSDDESYEEYSSEEEEEEEEEAEEEKKPVISANKSGLPDGESKQPDVSPVPPKAEESELPPAAVVAIVAAVETSATAAPTQAAETAEVNAIESTRKRVENSSDESSVSPAASGAVTNGALSEIAAPKVDPTASAAPASTISTALAAASAAAVVSNEPRVDQKFAPTVATDVDFGDDGGSTEEEETSSESEDEDDGENPATAGTAAVVVPAKTTVVEKPMLPVSVAAEKTLAENMQSVPELAAPPVKVAAAIESQSSVSVIAPVPGIAPSAVAKDPLIRQDGAQVSAVVTEVKPCADSKSTADAKKEFSEEEESSEEEEEEEVTTIASAPCVEAVVTAAASLPVKECTSTPEASELPPPAAGVKQSVNDALKSEATEATSAPTATLTPTTAAAAPAAPAAPATPAAPAALAAPAAPAAPAANIAAASEAVLTAESFESEEESSSEESSDEEDSSPAKSTTTAPTAPVASASVSDTKVIETSDTPTVFEKTPTDKTGNPEAAAPNVGTAKDVEISAENTSSAAGTAEIKTTPEDKLKVIEAPIKETVVTAVAVQNDPVVLAAAKKTAAVAETRADDASSKSAVDAENESSDEEYESSEEEELEDTLIASAAVEVDTAPVPIKSQAEEIAKATLAAAPVVEDDVEKSATSAATTATTVMITPTPEAVTAAPTVTAVAAASIAAVPVTAATESVADAHRDSSAEEGSSEESSEEDEDESAKEEAIGKSETRGNAQTTESNQAVVQNSIIDTSETVVVNDKAPQSLPAEPAPTSEEKSPKSASGLNSGSKSCAASDSFSAFCDFYVLTANEKQKEVQIVEAIKEDQKVATILTPQNEVKVNAEEKAKPVESDAIKPLQQEQFENTQKTLPLETDWTVNTPVQKIAVISVETPADVAVIELKPTRAYSQLKDFLVNDKQTDGWALTDNVVEPTLQKPTVHFDESNIVDRQSQDIANHQKVADDIVSRPKTAADYLEEARRIAEDRSMSLFSPHMLIVKSLVSQQEKLHDRLSSLRRQFANIDSEVTTIRYERYARTYGGAAGDEKRKKHAWSKKLAHHY